MNWNFDWQTPRRIVFGDGRFAELGAIAAQYGRRVALVTGGRSLRAGGRLDDLAAQFDRAGIDWLQLRIDHEPTVEAVDALTAEAAGFRPDMVVAMGGGSAMDTGKAVAALLTNGGEVLDYLEGVGRGRTLERPALPVIAVPTTAGTGTEATKNAVIGDRARTFKKSMRSDGMMPVVAVVDPELTHGCPPQVTAASGMDALTQLLETYTSNRAHVMSDAVAREGLQRVAAIDRLADGVLDAEQERTLRASMSYAALLGGMLLANVGLGAVHGLVSPLSGRHPIPHGAGCAALLPATVRANARRAALDGNGTLLNKYAAALELLTGESPGGTDPIDTAMALADYLAGLNRRLGLASLGEQGLTTADFPDLIAGGRGNSMKTNPVVLSDDELWTILEESL